MFDIPSLAIWDWNDLGLSKISLLLISYMIRQCLSHRKLDKFQSVHLATSMLVNQALRYFFK